MKKGFTLVELSIVLVIIGLLIGGILVAQSLVQTAQINSLVNQINQFDIAISNFKDKYKAIPGDINGVLDNGGDGDGALEDTDLNNGSLAYGTEFNYEVNNFWYHLSITGFQPDDVVYSNDASSGIRTGTHVPKAAYGKGDYGDAGYIIYGNLYWITDVNITNDQEYNVSTNDFNFPYSPIEMIAFEKKLGGDGEATAGDVVSAYRPAAMGATCYSGSTYLNSNDKTCLLRVSVLRDSGGLYR